MRVCSNGRRPNAAQIWRDEIGTTAALTITEGRWIELASMCKDRLG